MCGRFVSTQPPDKLAEYFGASFEGDALPANHNVAPTNQVYGVVGTAGGGARVEVFQWGLVPTWAKDTKIGSRLINARAETILEKPAFRTEFKRRRLLVPMDGFYEWQARPGTTKQPMFIHDAHDEPLAAAGLWSVWRDKEAGPDAPWLHTLTIITTAANATMTPVHDRMPVFLPRREWARWLDPANTDGPALQQLLVPAPDDLLVMHPVSTKVNNVRNKGADLIEQIDPETPA